MSSSWLEQNPALHKKEEYIFSILTNFQISDSFVSELCTLNHVNTMYLNVLHDIVTDSSIFQCVPAGLNKIHLCTRKKNTFLHFDQFSDLQLALFLSYTRLNPVNTMYFECFA